MRGASESIFVWERERKTLLRPHESFDKWMLWQCLIHTLALTHVHTHIHAYSTHLRFSILTVHSVMNVPCQQHQFFSCPRLRQQQLFDGLRLRKYNWSGRRRFLLPDDYVTQSCYCLALRVTCVCMVTPCLNHKVGVKFGFCSIMWNVLLHNKYIKLGSAGSIMLFLHWNVAQEGTHMSLWVSE